MEDLFHLGVKALIFNPSGEILLLEREDREKKRYWDLPGGRLQKGETTKETLFREVKEETGLEITNEVTPFTTVLTNVRIPVGNGSVGLIYAVFCCQLSEAFEPVLSDEHFNFGWFIPRQVSQKLAGNCPDEFIQSLDNFVLTE